MSIRFRLLNEHDVKSVLTMDDLIETMADALSRFSSGRVVQPVRTVISVRGDDAFFGLMPAFARAEDGTASFGGASPHAARADDNRARARDALGAKLVTVFG